MNCPHCGKNKDRVVDSRETEEGRGIRRRRECLACRKRFTTYEYVEQTSLMVIKKDGRREPFDRQKLFSGIMKSCEKRPVSMRDVKKIVERIDHYLEKNYEREVSSRIIGNLVMDHLAKVDQVAYVRFASVYRQFKDINQFMKELKGLLK